MTLFDTHAHLGDEQFAADRAETLARAKAAGVGRLVEIADAPADWDAAIALAAAHPEQVRCSLGLHPYYADQFSPALLERLRGQLSRPEVVAVGEIGLDYVKAEVGRDAQLPAFESLLAFCRDARKPAVIHCRGAYEDLRAVLSRVLPGPPSHARYWGVIHCFSGEEYDALFCRDLGFALGVDGPVTYPKNEPLRGALAKAGLDCLVLETDCPYLPPQSCRGKRNEPAKLPEIAARLAQACGATQDELASLTTRNALQLYGLS
jgi:TatD DNase family protein